MYIRFALSFIFISLQFFIMKMAFYPSIFGKNTIRKCMYFYITISGITGYNNSLTKPLKFF